MSRDEAKTKYIGFVSKIDPGWQDSPVAKTSTVSYEIKWMT